MIEKVEDKWEFIYQQDAVDSYFECVTACSLSDEGIECMTRCVEVYLKREVES